MMYFIPLCSSCTQSSFIYQNISHQPYETKIKENYFNTDEYTVIDSVINTIDAIDHSKQDYSSINLREGVSRYLQVEDYENKVIRHKPMKQGGVYRPPQNGPIKSGSEISVPESVFSCDIDSHDDFPPLG